MDPVTIGLVVSAVAGVASKALTPGIAGSSGGSGMFMPNFDNSGWAVNIGGGSATSSKQELPSAPHTISQQLGQASGNLNGLLGNPLMLVALLAVAYYVMKK